MYAGSDVAAALLLQGFNGLRSCAPDALLGSIRRTKTTISRVISDPDSYPSCALTWAKGQSLVCRVYNSDFVTRNFALQLPGIFTLGEAASETLDNIEKAKGRIRDLNDNIAKLMGTLSPADASSGKRGELRTLRAKFEADCWRIKGTGSHSICSKMNI
jgi:wobble nucleotide-excising tRNase